MPSDHPASSNGTPICPQCGQAILATDRFCPHCGHKVETTAETASYIPVAGAGSSIPNDPSTSGRRRRRRKKPWFRRPLFVIPLILFIVAGSAAGAFVYRTQSAIKDVQSISTPPAEIDSGILGGEEGIAIDTGPAQKAIADRNNARKGTIPVTPEATTVKEPTSNSDSTQAPVEPTGATDETVVPGPTQTASADGTGEANPETATAPANTGVADDGINILLMGVDARPGESIDVGVRSDSLGVLHLDPVTGSCRILSIPRDSRVDMPGYGMTKINHALAVGGIPFEQLVVEDYLDITMDHYALVDFAGVVQVVDAFGGITVDNPEAFEAGGHQFAKGLIELDGERALTYSRFRYTSEGDFGRVSKQQQVIKALMDKAFSADLVKFVPKMFSVMSDHFRTDFGVTDMLDLANDYRDSCTSGTIETRTIPGDVGNHHDDMMGMELSFVVSDPKVVQDHVAWLITGKEIDASVPGQEAILGRQSRWSVRQRGSWQ